MKNSKPEITGKQGDRKINVPPGYDFFLSDIKTRIRNARIKAALSVNREMIFLYLEIGRQILVCQQKEGWGKSVVERLSKDLRKEFPGMKGVSPRNLWDMRRLYESCQDKPVLRQLVAEVPWGHNLVLLNSVKDDSQREWYIRKTIENGWSRNVLALQINSGLHRRQGKALTNFESTLPDPQSELAGQALKDPYIFDFLNIAEDVTEKEIQISLLEHIKRFLLELGAGFTFVGSEYHLEIGGTDYFIDLLFYHLKLRAFVAIELKTGRFKPEYTGKMNFYLSAIDELLRHPDDQPSIGIILCRIKDKITVEYSLRDTKKPIGVAGYVLARKLSGKLKSSLPTIEEIEAELSSKKIN